MGGVRQRLPGFGALIETADVIVVGSGIIGASIGYQMKRHGVEKVVVLDKAPGPAEGSTGASSSICRCRYTNPEVVRLAYHGQEAYGSWPAFTGLDTPHSGLKRAGVLWMTFEPAARVEAEVSRLQEQGVSARALNPEEVKDRFPAISTDPAPPEVTGAPHPFPDPELFMFEDGGGYADPAGANQDLVAAARNLGADVRFGAEVVGVRRESHGRVTGVELADGTRLFADLVINAAGPWCNRLNAMAGVDLRWTLTPTRIQTLYRTWPPELGPLPVAADLSTGLYFRPESEGQQVLVGSVLPEDETEAVDDPDNFKMSPDADFRTMKMAAFHLRIPALAAMGEVTGIAGLYTINREDVHPVLGPAGVDGFWVANGFSGHGFKLAPGVGSMMATAYTGARLPFDTDVDMSFFSAEREPLGVAVKNVLA